MFKVISAAAAAHHSWLCNPTSAIRFALIWQMLWHTQCFASSCSVCVCTADMGRWNSPCWRWTLLSQWLWTASLDGSAVCLHLFVPMLIISLACKWPVSYRNISLYWFERLKVLSKHWLTWQYPSCLDDTTKPQVSLASAGIESLPANIKGIWIWGQVKQALC